MKFKNIATNKKFMITGGAGFIGSSLVRFLIYNTNIKNIKFYDNFF